MTTTRFHRVCLYAAQLAWSERRAVIVALLVAAVFGSVAFGQETGALRRLGVRFAWQSCADLATVVAVAAVVLSTLHRTPEADAWERRAAASATSLTLGRIAGLLLLSAGLATTTVALLFSLERILVAESDLDAAGRAWLQSVATAAPCAATAPALSSLARTPRSRILAWFALLGAGLALPRIGIPFPLDRLIAVGQGGGADPSAAALAAALATAAGSVLSLALDPRPDPGSGPPPCASASSATSTATSRH